MGNSLIFISAKAGVSAESMSGTAVERVFRHDGVVVAASLCLLTLLAWLFLLAGAGTGMDPVAMSGWLMPFRLPARSSEWTPLYWVAAFCMWVVMMVAMMLPSASPPSCSMLAWSATPSAKAAPPAPPPRSPPSRRPI